MIRAIPGCHRSLLEFGGQLFAAADQPQQAFRGEPISGRMV